MVKWSYWHFVPGALTILTTRAILCICFMATLAIGLMISMIGHKNDNEPITGAKAKRNKFLYDWICWLVLSISGFSLVVKEADFDYSEYLGKNYLMT